MAIFDSNVNTLKKVTHTLNTSKPKNPKVDNGDDVDFHKGSGRKLYVYQDVPVEEFEIQTRKVVGGRIDGG